MRDAVSAQETFFVKLSYWAPGNIYEDLKFSAAISPQLVDRIIPEICMTIYEVLASHYMKVL
jgi:hypothetical protein